MIAGKKVTHFKVDKITSGYRIRYRGADMKVNVFTPLQGRACQADA